MSRVRAAIVTVCGLLACSLFAAAQSGSAGAASTGAGSADAASTLAGSQAAPAAPQAAGSHGAAIEMRTLLQTGTAWDGTVYRQYPEGKPQVSLLRITIPARTTMNWHSHPMPNVAYVLSGSLTVERQDGTKRQHFTAGQAVAETIDASHRGVTGDEPVDLLVFYAGALDLPLSHPQGAPPPPAPAPAAR